MAYDDVSAGIALTILLYILSAISRRKLDHPFDVVNRAVNSLDLKTLCLDNVELLQRMVPTDAEVRQDKILFASWVIVSSMKFVDFSIHKSTIFILLYLFLAQIILSA